jgi:hypothetical protein
MTWQGKTEVAYSEKKLGNANLSTKTTIRIGRGSKLGPRDERPANNLLSHGTGTEACTSSNLFKLRPHHTEKPLLMRYRHQNVSAVMALTAIYSQYVTQITIITSGESKPLISLTECDTNNYRSV